MAMATSASQGLMSVDFFIVVGLGFKDKVNISTKPKIFFIFLYICAMETIKPKRGRTKLPENQRKRLVSAYLTDAEKMLILAKYGSLSNAVRAEILSKLAHKTTKDGHRFSYWD